MRSHICAGLSAVVLGLACARSVAHGEDSNTAPVKASAAVNSQAQASSAQDSSALTPIRPKARLPCQPFTNPPEKAHDPSANVFVFDQLEHYYLDRPVPFGEEYSQDASLPRDSDNLTATQQDILVPSIGRRAGAQ